MPAYNGRFCEMAAVTPQTILCEIERLSPAGGVVEAATSQSRWGVSCNGGNCSTNIQKKLYLCIFYEQIINTRKYAKHIQINCL